MNDIKKYWRDIVLDLLKWGTAVFILFVGWAASGNYKIFKIHEGSKDQVVAAVTLLIFTIAYTPLLPLAIKYIYTYHLHEGIDKTVIPETFAMWCARVVALLPLLVAILMVFI